MKPSNIVQSAFDRTRDATVLGQNDLTIWGGEFESNRLSDFLATWSDVLDKHLPWRMFEYVHRFDVVRGALPQVQNLAKLERARLFGEKGDLDIRRDGPKIFWRLIGDASIRQTMPQGFKCVDYWQMHPELVGNADAANTDEFKYADYWKTHPGIEFREIKIRYYQWRKTDERVNSIWLDAIGKGDEGVYLKQKQYLREGRVELVRYTGFDNKGVDNE